MARFRALLGTPCSHPLHSRKGVPLPMLLARITIGEIAGGRWLATDEPAVGDIFKVIYVAGADDHSSGVAHPRSQSWNRPDAHPSEDQVPDCRGGLYVGDEVIVGVAAGGGSSAGSNQFIATVDATNVSIRFGRDGSDVFDSEQDEWRRDRSSEWQLAVLRPGMGLKPVLESIAILRGGCRSAVQLKSKARKPPSSRRRGSAQNAG